MPCGSRSIPPCLAMSARHPGCSLGGCSHIGGDRATARRHRGTRHQQVCRGPGGTDAGHWRCSLANAGGRITRATIAARLPRNPPRSHSWVIERQHVRSRRGGHRAVITCSWLVPVAEVLITADRSDGKCSQCTVEVECRVARRARSGCRCDSSTGVLHGTLGGVISSATSLPPTSGSPRTPRLMLMTSASWSAA